MLDHTGFVVTDLVRARRFYDAIARPLGLATRDLNAESFLLPRQRIQCKRCPGGTFQSGDLRATVDL